MPTILVLDQNSTVQRMMKLTFKEESVQVNTVKPSEDAFAIIDAHPPDIVFTENARKVVAFLKSRPKLHHVRVVQLKGAFDSSASGADEEAADAVLTKPLQPDAMIDCVRRLLQAPAATAPHVEALPPVENGSENLDLEQYFDQLEVAFNEADGSSSRLDADLWETVSSPVVEVGHTRPTVTHAQKTDRPRLEPIPSSEPAVTNELVDQITQRVLDRLGERVARSTAAEVVSRLSKWLLVNELEKGKSTL